MREELGNEKFKVFVGTFWLTRLEAPSGSVGSGQVGVLLIWRPLIAFQSSLRHCQNCFCGLRKRCEMVSTGHGDAVTFWGCVRSKRIWHRVQVVYYTICSWIRQGEDGWRWHGNCPTRSGRNLSAVQHQHASNASLTRQLRSTFENKNSVVIVLMLWLLSCACSRNMLNSWKWTIIMELPRSDPDPSKCKGDGSTLLEPIGFNLGSFGSMHSRTSNVKTLRTQILSDPKT